MSRAAAATTETRSRHTVHSKLDIGRLQLQHATDFTNATQICAGHRLWMHPVSGLQHKSPSMQQVCFVNKETTTTVMRMHIRQATVNVKLLLN